MKSKYPLKSGQLTDKIALREEDNTFTEDNEFIKPLKVANPVEDDHAVNKHYVDKSNEPKVARFRKVGYEGQGNGEFEVVLDETMFNTSDATLTAGKVSIGSDGYYIVNITTNSGIVFSNIFYSDIYLNNTRLISSKNDAEQVIATANSGVIFLESGDELKAIISNLPVGRNVTVEISIQKL